MRHPQRSQLAAPVVLVYWLMVLGGLALFTLTRTDDVGAIVPLWVGAIGGTALGQYLAIYDFRLWIAGLIIALTGLYCEPLVPSGHVSAQLWQAFIPAALCGFWSLSDRGVLVAAWFPAVLWMLAILDRNEQQLAPQGVAAVLLGGLAVLFVVFLGVRESRRVSLWRTVSPEPLAPAQPTQLLREPPGRQLARAGWGLTVGAITVALTVWLAPPLWQTETLGSEVQIADEPTEGLPCCPVNRTADAESSRIKEYLDLGLGHDEHITSPREGFECRACGGPAVVTVPAVPVDDIEDPVVAGVDPSINGFGDGRVAVASAESGNQLPSATLDVFDPPPSEPVTPSWPTTVLPTPAPPTEVAVPDEPGAMLPEARPVTPPVPAAPAATQQPGATTRPAVSHRNASASFGASLLRWLALAAVAALLFQIVRIALRPLRRLVTLRHLRRPFWDETVDQRVSNAWQLALVGLRDAGWRAGATEAPHELARRVGVDGVDRCATVLERARHGVGLDADDLSEMQSAANVAYRTARSGISGLARMIALLRWPLT